MTPQFGSWVPYTGLGALALAAVLFVIASVLAFLGMKRRHLIVVQRPGKAISVFLVAVWILTLATLGICIETYALALTQQYGKVQIVANPVSPITTLCAFVTFILVAVFVRRHGWRIALGSALVGTIAAPMIFELPFDLIVGGRTYSPMPALLYTLLYFLPLILLEISSFSLLTLSPVAAISRPTFFTLAGMFLVFSIWALFGFAHPSSPLPFTFNVASKVLAFIVSITLFLPTSPDLQSDHRLSKSVAS
jgi:hypothetical protein